MPILTVSYFQPKLRVFWLFVESKLRVTVLKANPNYGYHFSFFLCLFNFGSTKTVKKLEDISCNSDDDESVINIISENATHDTVITLVLTGPSWGLFFNRIEMNLPRNQYKPNQLAIVKRVLDYFGKETRCSVLVTGRPGTGKSTIAFLLAIALNGELCKSYKPTMPGLEFSTLLSTAKQTKKKPLIVLLDEIDSTIKRISIGIPPHDRYTIWIYDKESFNNLLDDIQKMTYVILIMTSNKTKEEIDKSVDDDSFFRDPRVNLFETL